MATSLKAIKKPISAEIITFEKKFKEAIKNKVALLDKIMHYIVKRKGKQIRPMFVLLTAAMFGKITERTYRGASLIELLHTATLVHDDVIDDAKERRGIFSINAIWKNKIAVLVGDYLLSRGLLVSLENKDYDLLEIVSNAVKMMSEGELLQLEKARNMRQTEEVYFEIIKKKTASLIASCCKVGACSTSADEDIQSKSWQLGEYIGIAFQIKDDIFDYGKKKIGKPLGIDIKEKKMTLPLIYALSQAPKKESNKIRKIIKNKKIKSSVLNDIIAFVNKYKGIEYANEKMYQYYEKAKKMLQKFPKNQYQQSLLDLLDYSITRKE